MDNNLSVVIPTLGRAILIQTLKSLLRTRQFSSLDVIIAGKIEDSAVMHQVEALVLQYPQIRHFPVAFAIGDSSRKKNMGLHEARADIVAFIDDDVVVSPDWPRYILEPFADPEVGLVSGPSLVPDDLPLMARLAGITLASKASGYVAGRYLVGQLETRPIRWSGLIGCNMAYRKSVLESIGGFDPGFYPGEEMIAAYKATQAGHKLLFCPRATLYHYPRATLARFSRQIYTYGATRIRLYRAGVEFEAVALVPAIWLASLLVLAVAAPWHRVALQLFLLDVALYMVVTAAITLDKVRETRQWRDLLLLFLIPVMHISYGFAEWNELFRPGRDFSDQSVRRTG